MKIWTLNFALLCLASFAVGLPFQALLPTLPLYIENLGGAKETAGFALAALTAGAVASRPPAGWALERFGRKRVLMAGLVIFLAPTVVLCLLVPVGPLLAIRLIQGVGWGICTTAMGTAAADLLPRQRLGEGIGYFGATASIGMAVAPAVALTLIETASFQTLFVVCSVFAALAVLLAAVIRYPATDTPHDGRTATLFEPAAITPSLIMLCFTVTYSALLSFLALHARSQGIPSAGVFFTAMALSMLTARPLAGMLVDRRGRFGYHLAVYGGLALTAAALMVTVSAASPTHLGLAGLLYGLGFGLLQPTLLTLCFHRSGPARRGAATATYWTAFDIGVALGSLGWGSVAAWCGYALMYQLSLVPLALSAFLYLYGIRQDFPPENTVRAPAK